MQSFGQIQWQIGEWAVANFGGNETPYLTVREAGTITKGPRTSGQMAGVSHDLDRVVCLGGLAPLMGIVEEVGELFHGGGPNDKRDAVGDIAIYLCDYCCRENLPFPERIALDDREKHDPLAGMVIYMGLLYRCHLKRHQRIRGMHNYEEFNRCRKRALRGFVWHLHEYAKRTLNDNLLTILNMTWNEIVRKRDWKADAQEGGGHTHPEG